MALHRTSTVVDRVHNSAEQRTSPDSLKAKDQVVIKELSSTPTQFQTYCQPAQVSGKDSSSWQPVPMSKLDE